MRSRTTTGRRCTSSTHAGGNPGTITSVKVSTSAPNWAIQQLLSEAGVSGIEPGFVAPPEQGAEVQADWNNLGSSETYLGYAQATGFASAPGLVPDVRQVYATTGVRGAEPVGARR